MAPPDLDGWIERLRKCEHLEEDELKTLCEMVRQEVGGEGRARGPETRTPLFCSPCLFCHTQVKEILVEESNVQPVNSPVTVRGLCVWGGG